MSMVDIKVPDENDEFRYYRSRWETYFLNYINLGSNVLSLKSAFISLKLFRLTLAIYEYFPRSVR